MQPILEREDARVADLCCGTGDLAIALRAKARALVIASDFCHPMLEIAQRKARELPLFDADALALPLAGASVDGLTVAFGFRNLANYDAGLRELLRVLRPGGTAAILEFSTPPNPLFRLMYDFYSRRLLPVIGEAISGSRDAYSYLPESVRKFPDAEGLAAKMREAGFVDVAFERMTFGIVALHTGRRR